MFENIGGPELLLILVVIFLFFGAKKIPDIAKGLGQGIREFRKAARDIQEEVNKEVKQTDDKSEKKWLPVRQIAIAVSVVAGITIIQSTDILTFIAPNLEITHP